MSVQRTRQLHTFAATTLAAVASCTLLGDLDYTWKTHEDFQVYIHDMPDIDAHRDASYNSPLLEHNGKNHLTAVAGANLFWYAASNGLANTGFYAPTNSPWTWLGLSMEYHSYLRAKSMGDKMKVNQVVYYDKWGPCFSCFDEIEGQYNPSWEYFGLFMEAMDQSPGEQSLLVIRGMSFGGLSPYDGWQGGDIGQSMAAGNLVLLRVQYQKMTTQWKTFGQTSYSLVGINGEQGSLSNWEKRRIFMHEGDSPLGQGQGQQPPSTESAHWWPNAVWDAKQMTIEGKQQWWYYSGIPISHRSYQPGPFPGSQFAEIRALANNGWTIQPPSGYSLHYDLGKLVLNVALQIHVASSQGASAMEFENAGFQIRDFAEDQGNLRIFVSGTDALSGQHSIRVLNRLTGEWDPEFTIPLTSTIQPATLAVSNLNALYAFDSDRLYRMHSLRSDDPIVESAFLQIPVSGVTPDDINHRMLAISVDGSKLMVQPYLFDLEPEWITLPAAINLDGKAYMDVNPVDGSIWIASEGIDQVTRLVADPDDPRSFQISTFQPVPGVSVQGVSFDDNGILHLTLGNEVWTYRFDQASGSFDAVESLFTGTYSPGPFRVLKSRDAMAGQLSHPETTTVPFLDYDPLENPPCAIDLNSDGVIDGTDLATLLGDWGQVTEWSAFMDPESPEVNGTDLATLLGAWGPCTAE